MMMQSTRISLSLCAALSIVAAGCGQKPADTGGTTGTTGTTAIKVADITLGRALSGDKSISDATDTFRANDTIYASVATDGSAPSATLRARWTFEDGQTVDESTRTIAPGNRERTEFHISKPNGWPAGKYKVEVFLNDQSAGTKTFEVPSSLVPTRRSIPNSATPNSLRLGVFPFSAWELGLRWALRSCGVAEF